MCSTTVEVSQFVSSSPLRRASFHSCQFPSGVIQSCIWDGASARHCREEGQEIQLQVITKQPAQMCHFVRAVLYPGARGLRSLTFLFCLV